MNASFNNVKIDIGKIVMFQHLYFFNNRPIRKIINDNIYFLQNCHWDEFIEYLSKQKQYHYDKVSKTYKWGNIFSKSFINKAYQNGLKSLKYLESNPQIKILQESDKDYPNNKLSVLGDDAPIILYCIGNTKTLTEKAVAIIGTREPDDEYIIPGSKISSLFVKNNFIIVSGLALGCDTIGHAGALEAHGKTVAILANGLETIYPRQNQELAMKIVEKNGCLVTEYPPYTKIERWHFSQRDRLQSAFSDLLFVISTGEKGGTLITVNYATKQKKPIYTFIPNRATLKSAGNFMLIEQKKAKGISINNIEDILEFIKLENRNNTLSTRYIKSLISGENNKRSLSGFKNYFIDEYSKPSLFDDDNKNYADQLKEPILAKIREKIFDSYYRNLEDLLNEFETMLLEENDSQTTNYVVSLFKNWLSLKEKRYK